MRIALVLGLLACTLLLISERHVAASVIASQGAYEPAGEGLFLADSERDTDLARAREQWSQAKARVVGLLGPLESEPVVVLPPTKSAAAGFGVPEAAPGSAFTVPWATYIVLAPDGRNVDVMAHELVHAELAERLGYLRYSLGLPTWFDEGLAMQVDWRDEAIAKAIRDGAPLPPVASLESNREFAAGHVALNYAASQVEVARWLDVQAPGGAAAFIREIGRTGDFDSTYQRYDRDLGR